MAWDPELYLRFAGPRLRPALDLLAQVAADDPAAVCDLGCGTGTATRLLAARWPRAALSGVDSSAEMLATARCEPGGEAVAWLAADIGVWRAERPVDVLFSNAALHWLDDHGGLFPRLLAQLAPGGILAVQMPRNHAAPAHQAIFETALAGPWRSRLEPLLRRRPVAEPAVYHDLLAPLAAELDIWETEYLHRLSGERPVLQWIRSTALAPLLAALDEPEREAFLDVLGERLAEAYPPRRDSTTLFPFRRLFIVARVA